MKAEELINEHCIQDWIDDDGDQRVDFIKSSLIELMEEYAQLKVKEALSVSDKTSYSDVSTLMDAYGIDIENESDFIEDLLKYLSKLKDQH